MLLNNDDTASASVCSLGLANTRSPRILPIAPKRVSYHVKAGGFYIVSALSKLVTVPEKTAHLKDKLFCKQKTTCQRNVRRKYANILNKASKQ